MYVCVCKQAQTQVILLHSFWASHSSGYELNSITMLFYKDSFDSKFATKVDMPLKTKKPRVCVCECMCMYKHT